jgi:hypothetical protein
MTYPIYIDGEDIFELFGAYILSEGVNELLTFPSLKEPPRNDWPEEDGIEVDLSEPVLNSRELNIPFCAENANGFIDFLSTPGYHIFNIPALGKEWKLRLVSQGSNNYYKIFSSFSLTFSEDSPVRATNYPAPTPGIIIPKSDYEIDDIPFSRYGVFVSSGKDDLLKSPSVKKNLLTEILEKDGSVYDVGHLVFNSKESTLQCVMAASTIPEFWKCYNAFFNDWIKPGERFLYINSIEEEYPCYYKKSDGFEIVSLTGTVIVKFNLTLVFTVFRLSDTEYILAAEDDSMIVLERDGITGIDMNVYK